MKFIATFEVKAYHHKYICSRLIEAESKESAKQIIISRNPDHHLFYLKVIKATKVVVANFESGLVHDYLCSKYGDQPCSVGETRFIK